MIAPLCERSYRPYMIEFNVKSYIEGSYSRIIIIIYTVSCVVCPVIEFKIYKSFIIGVPVYGLIARERVFRVGARTFSMHAGSNLRRHDSTTSATLLSQR